jgi:hypothetical protein
MTERTVETWLLLQNGRTRLTAMLTVLVRANRVHRFGAWKFKPCAPPFYYKDSGAGRTAITAERDRVHVSYFVQRGKGAALLWV